MTEALWLACADPGGMLTFLSAGPLPPTYPFRYSSDRKLRLFACACVRQVWGRLTDEDRRLVKVAERHADGPATAEELQRAGYGVPKLAGPGRQLRIATRRLVFLSAGRAARRVSECLAGSGAVCAATQAALLCDLAGNPWRPVDLEVSPGSWLVSTVKGGGELTYAWRADPVVAKLARAIYDGRDWAALPLLADALEEAGCDSEDLLRHCRGPGPHARGCWALDLVLGLV